MHDDRIVLGDLIQQIARPAAGVHEVFGYDLEPIDAGLMVQNIRKMDRAQSKAEPKVRKPKSSGVVHGAIPIW